MLVIVGLVVFITFIGIGIIVPLFPFFGERIGASPETITLAVAVGAFGQLISTPFWGWLSDRIGRKPVLLLSLLGSTLANVLLAYADTLPTLLFSRLVAGLMSGIIAVAFAAASDVTVGEQRAKAMGRIGACFSFGFMMGPALGGLLAGENPASTDYFGIAMMAAGLDVLALVLAVLFLRETHPAGERSGAPMFDRQLARRSLQHPVLMKMCLANLLFAGSFAVIDSMLPLFGNRVHGLSPVQIGYMFTFMGLMSTLVQAFAVGRVSARFGVFSSVIAGLALFGVGQMFIAVSGSSATMVVGGFCIAAGFAIFNAPASTIVTTAVSPTERGTVLGIFQGAGNVGRTLTPLYSGWLFTAIGPAAPFVGASLIMVPAIGALWRARRAAELTTST
jgi:DHA1 family tetracycline resistance protein-like MFS transporter